VDLVIRPSQVHHCEPTGSACLLMTNASSRRAMLRIWSRSSDTWVSLAGLRREYPSARERVPHRKQPAMHDHGSSCLPLCKITTVTCRCGMRILMVRTDSHACSLHAPDSATLCRPSVTAKRTVSSGSKINPRLSLTTTSYLADSACATPAGRDYDAPFLRDKSSAAFPCVADELIA
jgi:hypothetical protein